MWKVHGSFSDIPLSKAQIITSTYIVLYSNDPKEMYNNILIYIVGHPPEESPNPSEMHIFQCSNVRARDVVEDIKSFMNGGGDRLRYDIL